MNNTIQPGEELTLNQTRTSPSGQWHLIYQTDGNLVLYDVSKNPWSATWQSRTAGMSVGRCVMQADGNFVIYDAGGIARVEWGQTLNIEYT